MMMMILCRNQVGRASHSVESHRLVHSQRRQAHERPVLPLEVLERLALLVDEGRLEQALAELVVARKGRVHLGGGLGAVPAPVARHADGVRGRVAEREARQRQVLLAVLAQRRVADEQHPEPPATHDATEARAADGKRVVVDEGVDLAVLGRIVVGVLLGAEDVVGIGDFLVEMLTSLLMW